jgi:hypothetical protein
MLWYKAWLETRSRFLISLIGMVALCSVLVLHGDRNVAYEVSSDYYNFVLFEGHQILVMMWTLAVTLTMMGGLLRGEYTAPAVSFGAVIVTAVALSSSALRRYSPWEFMTGARYRIEQTNLLSLPIPWLQAAIYMFVAGLLLAISVRAIQRREF